MTREPRTLNGKWQSLQQMVLKKLDNHMENTEIVPLPYTTHKKLTWIKDLNIRSYTIKLLKENRKTWHLPWQQDFFGMWHQKQQAKINEQEYIKLKKLCTAIETIFRNEKMDLRWIRICLSMQGTWVPSLVWEDPTCHGATKPMNHNYWESEPRTYAPEKERSPQWKALAP